MEYRRHSGSKVGRAQRTGMMRTIVVIILSVLLIAAIVVVSPLGEMLFGTDIVNLISCDKTKSQDQEIISALKQQENTAVQTARPSPSEKSHQVITIEGIQYYILQMSAFTNLADAEQHAEEIRRLGAGGIVYTEGSVYRVFAAAYLDENSLMKVHSQVRADGFEATPYITEKKTLKLTLDGDMDAIKVVQDAIELINNVPKVMCELCLSYDKGEIDNTGVYNELRKLQESCDSCVQSLGTIHASSISQIEQLLKNYAKSISTFLNEHDTIDAESVSGDLKYLQLSLIVDYILFFDRK